jgi:hypothetical protein
LHELGHGPTHQPSMHESLDSMWQNGKWQMMLILQSDEIFRVSLGAIGGLGRSA